MMRAKIVLVGLVTLASAVMTVLAFLAFFSRWPITESRFTLDVYSLFCVLHGLLFWFYYRNVFRNPLVPTERRDLWTIILFVGFAFAQLFYFWRYLRRQPSSEL